jgi:site-specific DNA-methyltransferase (adenine-specific)
LGVLAQTPDESVDLVYIDPPFGTGATQSAHGMEYGDLDTDYAYMDNMYGYLVELHRVLKKTGTLYLHLDWHYCHYARTTCDYVFGRANFLNEVIWAYDYGGRGKDRWPRKHDNILVYTKYMPDHIFNWDDIDRIPYMAPGLQKDPARAAAGKVPTDVWWMSIVGTSSKERTGYPTQKPVKLIERAVLASSPPGGLVMDVFAGSGTTGEAAHKHGRSFILADVNPQAIEVMKARFKNVPVEWRQ